MGIFTPAWPYRMGVRVLDVSCSACPRLQSPAVAAVLSCAHGSFGCQPFSLLFCQVRVFLEVSLSEPARLQPSAVVDKPLSETPVAGRSDFGASSPPAGVRMGRWASSLLPELCSRLAELLRARVALGRICGSEFAGHSSVWTVRLRPAVLLAACSRLYTMSPLVSCCSV
ncbi:unnamed protein product [Amoebophrya sp. A120]|nr:unnamed protein product [Amoebophrya sp. A120]|eukprot:GSA120T00008225001.1